MIKVGIYGPAEVDSPVRKQLLRLLFRHPDVDLRAVASPAGNATPLSQLHPVYSGETTLTLERVLKLDNLDVLFVIDEENLNQEIMARYTDDKDFRLIVLGHASALIANPADMVYGFPEYNRKALVRGARAAVNPSAAALIIELALFPLAKFGLLNSEIKVSIGGIDFDATETAAESQRLLSAVQPSFSAPIRCSKGAPTTFERIDLHACIDTGIALDEIERIYNTTYEDHNFTYLIPGEGTIDEDLRGSNKCLIRLSKHDGTLTIDASIDALTRGVTGNAVHIMNLLFGLYERTGLAI